jgi:DNA mismatch repair ATPase MutL
MPARLSHCDLDVCILHTSRSDGVMDPAGPKPCAGMPGTTMLVEDMFYNVPTRQKAIRSGSEEHARILDMVGHYAIFATAVGMTVKRHGEARPDLHTTAGAGQLEAIRRAGLGTNGRNLSRCISVSTPIALSQKA